MLAYLFDDCSRIEGRTGNAVEAAVGRNKVKAFNDDYRKGASNKAISEFDASKNFEKYLDGISLLAVKNEYVSFQIALENISCPIDDIELLFEDLNGESGRIEAKYGRAYYEWFHSSAGLLVPDMLLPWDERHKSYGVEEKAKEYHDSPIKAFWVDWFVPRATSAGCYEGKMTVKAGAEEKSFVISLKVADAVLCDETTVTADMNNYADTIVRDYPNVKADPHRYTDGCQAKVEQAYHRLCHDNRALFHYLGYTHSGHVVKSFAPEIEGSGKGIRVKSWDNFDMHVGALLDGSAFADTARGPIPVPVMYTPFNFNWPSLYEKWGTPGYRTENRRIMQQFIAHCEEKGWTETVFEIFLNHKKRYRFYPYDGDETRFPSDEEIFHVYYDMFHDLVEDTKVKLVFRTDSSWSFGNQYATELSDKFNMWVASGTISSWFPESFETMRQKGNTMWIYGGLERLEIDMVYSLGWTMKCVMNGIRGFTMWNTTGLGKDYLDCPVNNGTEIMYYPGCPFGVDEPFPSIRLKYQRNCIQLADLINMNEGTDEFAELKKCVNKRFGTTDESWYNACPEFAVDPPYTWTNEKIGAASYNDVCKGVPSQVLSQIKGDVVEVLTRPAKPMSFIK